MDRLEILSECLIKVENVKQEPDECGREEACNFMGGEKTCSLKSEVKKKGNEVFCHLQEGERTCPLKSEVKEKDEEEELKPSVRLFLDPEEVPEQVPQEHKDPLAMCNENLDKSSWPVGDECDPERLISSVSTHNGPESLNSDNAIHANTRSVSKSVIKLEEIKQEPEDSVTEPVWNSTHLEDSVKTELKEDDDEELEPPVTIFLQEDIKEEVEWGEEEEKEEVEDNLCGKDFDVGSEGNNRNSGSVGTSKNVEPANQAKIENGPGKQVEVEVEVPKADPTSQVSPSNNLPYPQRKYTCSYCSKTFRLQCHLKTHIRTHTGSKPYSCPQCLSCFSQMAHLQKHMRAHSGERPHQCQVCNRAFKERYQLVTHQYTHSGQWPYRCPVCGKGFAFYTRLSKHAQVKHQEAAAPPAPRRHECGVCRKRFGCSSHLAAHARTHGAERRRFRCAACPKRFARRQALERHARAHSADRPFACHACPERFARKEHLQRHARTHTGERPFACGVCRRAFIQKDGLVKHMRKHSGERPHACALCTKTYSQRSGLKDGLAIHKRKHSCEVCGKDFAQRSSLVVHMRARTAGEEVPQAVVERAVCQERFAREEHLQRHAKTHTGERPFA
ncbi:Protein suppressor of hairy wing [Gryllus bimaculatus]|nr:Protein suppressor of hairy wing [Gryllus bimaculatus]